MQVHFNEAAASMLRKVVAQGFWLAVDLLTSMRPQHRCCGRDHQAGYGQHHHGHFNEAAASMLRKGADISHVTPTQQDTLQ